MKMPRRRLDGCACTSPLAHFYIYHAGSSIRELHPFSTITHLASERARTSPDEDDLTVRFLFRRRSRPIETPQTPLQRKAGLMDMIRMLSAPKGKGKIQWTDKLASEAHSAAAMEPDASAGWSETSTEYATGELDIEKNHPTVKVALRLEGPYFTPAEPSRFDTVICLVAGTGISGAISIANGFAASEQRHDSSEPCSNVSPGGACSASMSGKWKRCVVVWSVREEDYVDLPFFRSKSWPLPGLLDA